MPTRRKFLWGGLGVAAIAGLGVWGFGRMGMEAEIVARVRRRLSFLQLDEPGLHAFAHDQVSAMLAKKFPTWNRWRYHFLSLAAPSFKRYDHSTDTRSRVVRAEDSLASMFLLSSDFFANGSDESRLIRYVAYFDPLRACSNPFARSVGDVPAASQTA